MDHNPNIDPSPSPTNEWTENQEQLLVGWAEKASGYVWLHNRGTQYFKKRNRYISIPAVFFAYAAGSSAFLLTDEIDLFYIKAFIGVASIISGLFSTFQEMFMYKEESERHRIAALRFSSFFRDISSEMSIRGIKRTDPNQYITLKRIEFDRILEQSPDVPRVIIDEFNLAFEDVEVHKPDVTIGLQTILPYHGETRRDTEASGDEQTPTTVTPTTVTPTLSEPLQTPMKLFRRKNLHSSPHVSPFRKNKKKIPIEISNCKADVNLVFTPLKN